MERITNRTFWECQRDSRTLSGMEKAGFFAALWKACLAEYNDLEGIAWRWQSIDGAMMKTPLAQEALVPNPADQGKNGSKRHLLVDGRNVPLSFIVTGANRHEVSQLEHYCPQSWSKDPSRPCAEASICVQTLDTRERRCAGATRHPRALLYPPRKGVRTRSC